MRILNYDEIVHFSSSLRKKARGTVLDLFCSAVETVDPYRIVSDNLTHDSEKRELIVRNTRFSSSRKIWVIGAGKAIGRMAEALEKVLSGLEYSGIICVPERVKSGLNLRKIQCLESTHPIPSEVNIHNTNEVLELIKKIKPEDLVIALVSGGGSAIWAAPTSPMTINDLITLNMKLINSGMNIHEINVVRKHASLIKGGKLVKQIPAEVIVLVLSDVIGDNLESIASGPFYPDSSTFYDARHLLDQYQLWDNAIPSSARIVIEQGINGKIPETTKANEHVFQRVQTHILGSNKLACNSIISNAKKLGLNTILLTNKLEGEARWLGRLLARIYCGIAEGSEDPFLVISGGEPTVKVRGEGIGGRNQEIVAAVLNEFSSLSSPPDITFLSAGTDGIDGNSPYAGALVDDRSVKVFHQRALNLTKYQRENNLSKFFEELGGSLLLSGPTGTNVMDLQIAMLNTSNFH